MVMDFAALNRELQGMVTADQSMRNRVSNGDEWDPSIDRHNTARMQEIIARLGRWPLISEVGPTGSQNLWVLAQHADADLVFQKQCLELMRKVPAGEIRLDNIAYLDDRIRVAEGRPQLYGTQFAGAEAALQPRPIEDEERLDERRAAVGLEPFEVYRAQILELYSVKEQHKASDNS